MRLRIGLISHLIRDYNLGCSALAISNILLMDEVFEKYNIVVEYIVILAEPKDKICLEDYTSLDEYTKNSFSYRTYPRLKPILKNPFLLKKTKAFDGCDYVIDLCGGDGYTDNYGLIRLLAESLPVIVCKMKNVQCFFAPQTIGPFNSFIGKFIAQRTLRNLQTIFVRDQSSFECCEKLGLGNSTLQVIDVAFVLPFTKQRMKNGKFNVGINVSGLLYNGGYNCKNYFKLAFSYKDFISRLIETLSECDGIQIHLIPHVIDDEEGLDDDYSVCRLLNQRYDRVILPDKFNNATQAKSYISAMDLFSGARMHSTIGAVSGGVPVIPVAYSRKFNGLYDTLEYPYYIDAKAKQTVDEAIQTFMHYMNCIEELRKGIGNAQRIYNSRLENYKNKLTQIMDLH